MKRLIAIMVSCFMLVGCGSYQSYSYQGYSYRDDIDKDVFETFVRLLNITEKYNNGDIRKEDAQKYAESILAYAESIQYPNRSKIDSDTIDSKTSFRLTLVMYAKEFVYELAYTGGTIEYEKQLREIVEDNK